MDTDTDATVGAPRAKHMNWQAERRAWWRLGGVDMPWHPFAACGFLPGRLAAWEGKEEAADGTDLVAGIVGYCSTEEGVKGTEKVGKGRVEEKKSKLNSGKK